MFHLNRRGAHGYQVTPHRRGLTRTELLEMYYKMASSAALRMKHAEEYTRGARLVQAFMHLQPVAAVEWVALPRRAIAIYVPRAIEKSRPCAGCA